MKADIIPIGMGSLSARRAWIEIHVLPMIVTSRRRSPQGERG